MSRTFVTYLRVSTDRQGRSGLGIEAQEAAIAAFLAPGDKVLVPSYVEVESGRKDDRPQLQRAIEKCRQTGATLLIARLDRLARNVRFIASLMELGVPFIAVDMPSATPFTLHIYAAVAEETARTISLNTKAALAAAKARGVALGGNRGYRPAAPPSPALAAAGRVRAADVAAGRVAHIIETIRADLGGKASQSAIAAELQRCGIQKPRGGTQWTATDVRRIVERIANMETV